MTFFAFICCKNFQCLERRLCLERRKIDEKEAGDGPSKKVSGLTCVNKNLIFFLFFTLNDDVAYFKNAVPKRMCKRCSLFQKRNS